MSEISFFQDSSVHITNTRAVLGSKTYAMANITSVSMGEIPSDKKTLSIMTIIIGIIVLVFGCFMSLFIGIVIVVSDGFNRGITLIMMAGLFGIVGALVLLGGIILFDKAKPSYTVRIGSASGEANILVSKNRDYIAGIVMALNQAIITRN